LTNIPYGFYLPHPKVEEHDMNVELWIELILIVFRILAAGAA